MKVLVLSFDCSDDRTGYAYTKVNPNITSVMLPMQEVHFKHHGNQSEEIQKLRTGAQYEMLRLLQSMSPVIDQIPYVLIPHGLYHPQHQDCALACLNYFGESQQKLACYVDQPYYEHWSSDEETAKIREGEASACLVEIDSRIGEKFSARTLELIMQQPMLKIETPGTCRRTLMRDCFRPKYLMGLESKTFPI